MIIFQACVQGVSDGDSHRIGIVQTVLAGRDKKGRGERISMKLTYPMIIFTWNGSHTNLLSSSNVYYLFL